MDKILLIDLGGTYIRFVVLSTESNEIDSVNKKKLQSTEDFETVLKEVLACLLYTSPSPRDPT